MPSVELAEVRHLIESGEARRVRERARVPQSEVARDLGVHETTVAKWERGQRLPRGVVALNYGRLLRQLERAVR